MSIAVPKVVDIDISGLKVNFNTQFNFTKEIEDQVKLRKADQFPDFNDLSTFGQRFIT